MKSNLKIARARRGINRKTRQLPHLAAVGEAEGAAAADDDVVEHPPPHQGAGLPPPGGQLRILPAGEGWPNVPAPLQAISSRSMAKNSSFAIITQPIVSSSGSEDISQEFSEKAL